MIDSKPRNSPKESTFGHSTPVPGQELREEERETSKSILSARVTSVRVRVVGSTLIILLSLLLAALLYSVSFTRLEQAVVSLEEELTQPGLLAGIRIALHSIWEVPLAWGVLIGIAALSAGFIIIRSIVHPAERLTEAATRLAAGNLDERVQIAWADEFGRLGNAFNEMADQLQASYAELEERVDKRTRALRRRALQLEASAEVGRAITSIFDIDELLRRAVNLIPEHLGFYHASIFLLDESRGWAVLRAATGDVGAQMKAQGHRLRVGETSMVGWTALHREPRIALDADKDEMRFAHPLLPNTRSEMTLPLMFGEQLLGVLNVQSTKEAAFGEDDVQALQSMANQIAVAIQNARRISEEAALLEATSPLYRISRRLTTATTIDEVTDAIIDSVAETAADGCTVILFEFAPDGEPQALSYTGVWRRDREPKFVPGMRLSIAQNPVPLRMASTLWTAPNVAQDARLPLRARRVFEEIDAAAVANIPLRTKEKVIGQMLILRTIPGPFPEADVRLYEILSDQAAVALERARLLEMSRRQADEEAVLRAVGDRLARAVDLETLMQTTADELSRVLQTSGVYFELGPGPDTRENSSSVEVLGG